ncbi:sirohydrochlorin chelatase [Rhabdochromatium marinum]|uniref:sirohydrochlorin chelatase n=1 Tax=Rhabdochromatium marinum TaxID=48729 RepID=UPI0019054684|nr:sirohydrochlorin chelatase [Rhabdochromatium marinum]MBK1649889.1 cobalamin biosynthesis protein CbiX [Rhabdochromatium marinum]
MTDEVVLLAAHGARDPGFEGNREVQHCTARWRERHPDTEIQVCWIEHAPVLLEEGLERAVASLDAPDAREGGGRVLVLPLILNAASHVKGDIPHAIAAARERHPGVEFRYGWHLGTTEQLLKALRHRLHAAMAALHMPDPRTTGVVLLARGASDREATGEVAKMAHWLFETTQHELIMPAFTDCCFPRLEQVVQRLDALACSQIIVLPYYLFTGRLIKRIREQVARLGRQYPTRVIHQADYINDHEQLLDLLDLRLQQCRDGSGLQPCDGCALALATEGHTHDEDHHHKGGLNAV